MKVRVAALTDVEMEVDVVLIMLAVSAATLVTGDELMLKP